MNKIPIYILAALTLLGLGMIAEKHGKPRENYSFWDSLFSSAINWALIIWMVWP